MTNALSFIQKIQENGFLPWSAQKDTAERFGLSLSEVEKIALEIDILPLRYKRNLSTVTAGEQLKLFNSRVAVVGCGGLGGYIIEEITRLGIGNIVAIDHDIIEEHNLNRQLLSNINNMGSHKVDIAFKRVKEINPAVTLTPFKKTFTLANGADLLKNCDLAIDALDSIPCKQELANVCKKLEIPLIHGAIAGWYGQIATILPADSDFENIYPNCSPDSGIENRLGNPAFTPALIASLQVAEVCKVLLNKGELMSNRKLFIDLLGMEFNNIFF